MADNKNSDIAKAKSIIGDHYSIKILHYHEGNDPEAQFRRVNGQVRSYVTIAKIRTVDTEVQTGIGISICNPKDTPNRGLGLRVALNRALKMHCERINPRTNR